MSWVKLLSFHALAMFLRHDIKVVATREPKSRSIDSLKGRWAYLMRSKGVQTSRPLSVKGDRVYVVGWLSVGEETNRCDKVESQWIVAVRPLCHLQYLVTYLSYLQRILPATRSRCVASLEVEPEAWNKVFSYRFFSRASK